MSKLESLIVSASLGLFAIAAAACSSPAPAPDSAAQPVVSAPTPPPAVPVESPAPITPQPVAFDAGIPGLPGVDGGFDQYGNPLPPGPPPGGACTVNTGKPLCDQCIGASCCAQVSQCSANQDCVALDSCTAQCQVYGAQAQQCEAQCYQMHPQGAAILQGVYQCVDTVCATQCQ